VIKLNEKTAKFLKGLLIISTILGGTAGATVVTYKILETGKYGTCKTGWEFQTNGDQAGQYGCFASDNPRYETCVRLRNTSTGKINYFCDKGVLQEVIVPIYLEPEENKNPARVECFINGSCIEYY
jgi:hypothetical protein